MAAYLTDCKPRLLTAVWLTRLLDEITHGIEGHFFAVTKTVLKEM
jgi:hypothetical protein